MPAAQTTQLIVAFVFLQVVDAFVLPPLPSCTTSTACVSFPRNSLWRSAMTTRRFVAFQDSKRTHESSEALAVKENEEEEELLELEGKYYQWKHGPVHYVEAGTEAATADTAAILLLPGFGVSSSHYERNIGPLAASGYHVFAIDYLGQGKSWPDKDPEKEDQLVLSIDTWSEQIISFIRDVIGRPVYISGNSLGGFLATTVAARHHEWIRGVVLLNSTPFWSFAPNRKTMHPWVKEAIIPYDGVLPAPRPLYEIGSRWYNSLRNKETVKAMLGAVYADEKAWGDRLVEQILVPTEHKHGQSVFTSILFAPKPEHTFEETLTQLQQKNIPLLLLYGKEDPWIFPSWGQRVKRQVSLATYYELSPAGHCPHHETPVAVNALILEWLQKQNGGAGGGEDGGIGRGSKAMGSGVEGKERGEGPGGDRGSTRTYFEPVTGKQVTATLMDGRPRDTIEWLLANTVFR